MKTLATALADEAFADLKQITDYLQIAPEEFASRILTKAIERQKTRMLEAAHERGYVKKPIQPGEFDLHPDDLKLLDTDEAW